MEFKDREALQRFIDQKLDESRNNPIDEGDEMPGADLSFNHLYHLSRIQEQVGYSYRKEYRAYLEIKKEDPFWGEYIKMFLLV